MSINTANAFKYCMYWMYSVQFCFYHFIYDHSLFFLSFFAFISFRFCCFTSKPDDMRVGKWVTIEMTAPEYGKDGESPLLRVRKGEGLVHDPSFHQAQLNQYQHSVLKNKHIVSFHKFDFLDDMDKMVQQYRTFLECPECLAMKGTGGLGGARSEL